MTKKLSKKNAPPSEEVVREQVHELFPSRPVQSWKRDKNTEITRKQLTSELEVTKIIADLKNKKAPGPDSITAVILKKITEKCQPTITYVMNKFLIEAKFPDIWKKSRLVLIKKPAKNSDDEKTYRPICIMDTLSKVLERLINVRLQNELEEKNALHENQFGLRRGRSTIDAIKSIEEVVKEISNRSYTNQKCCTMVALDIKNVFNSAPWDKIIKSLEKANISGYLRNLIKEYLTNRKIILPDEI